MSLDNFLYSSSAEDLDYPSIRPTLDLNFIKSQRVPPFINVVRNSQTTYVDKFGILRTAGINQPVFEWDPITGECLGARVWGVVTNRILNSVASVNVTISAGTTTGPNNQLMSKAVPAAGSVSFPSVGGFNTQSFSLTSGQTIDVAIGGWFAAGSSGMQIEPRLVVQFGSGQTNLIYAELQVNTSNWTVRSRGLGPGVSEVSAPVIQAYAPSLFPGLYRVDWVVRYTQGATVRDNFANYVQMRDTSGIGTFTSDGIGHFQFFGLQGTASSTPQPYVPTTTTAASSTADAWSIKGADFNRIYNQSAVTFYFDGSYVQAGTSSFPRMIAAVGSNPNTDEVSIYGRVNTGGGDGRFYGSSTIAETSQFTLGEFTSPVMNSGKAAAAFALDDAAMFDGQASTTDNTGTLPVAQELRIMGQARFQPMPNGYIRQLKIFPKRLTNSQLRSLTR